MYKLSCVFACMIMVMLIQVWSANGQKSYSIVSIVSNITLSQSDGCISMKIIEDFEYEFNGSYSRIGRAFPYSIFPKIEIDSYNVEVLTQGYSVSYQMQGGDISRFLVSTLKPATPTNSSTRISIRISMVVSPKVDVVNSNTLWRYYYKDNAPISFISTSIQLDPSFASYSLNASNGQLQNHSQIVTFTTNNLANNTEFQPSVTINNFIATNCYFTSGIYIFIGTLGGFIVLVILIVSLGLTIYYVRNKGTGCFKKEKPIESSKPTPSYPTVSTIKESTSYKTTAPSTKSEEVYYSHTYDEPVTSNYSSGYDNSNWCSNTGGGGDYGGGGGGGGCDYGGSSGFAD